MKITREILMEFGADEIHGMESNYSGIGWYMKEFILEWNSWDGFMYLSFKDNYYDVKTGVCEVDDLKELYRLLGGEELK